MEVALPLGNRGWCGKVRIIAVALLLVLLIASIGAVVSAYDFNGDFISSKLLEGSGVSSSILTIGGEAGSSQDVMMGAIASTLPATNIGTKQATLNGNLSDLNGFPEATVYFEWGYDTSYGNTTGSQTLNLILNIGIEQRIG